MMLKLSPLLPNGVMFVKEKNLTKENRKNTFSLLVKNQRDHISLSVSRTIDGNNFIHDIGSGFAGHFRNNRNVSAPLLDFIASDNSVFRPVAAFDQDIRFEVANDFQRRQFREYRYKINTFQRGEHFRSFFFGD